MSRYRKIEVRTWADENFRALSPLVPSGQALWFFLLTGPHTGPIPGLFRAGRAALAEELGWSTEEFNKAFDELATRGMAKADFRARLVWLPNALKHNLPESPNVVRSWLVEIDLLPECALKDEALAQMRAVLTEKGPAFVAALDESPKAKACAKAWPKALAKPKPNQEQEQDQDQDKLGGDAGADELTRPASAVDISIALRKQGVRCQPHHPHLVKLAEAGITLATVQAAHAEARQTKGPTAEISLGYLLGILKRWQEEAAALPTAAVGPPARASPGANPRDASRMAAAASIGLGGTHGRDTLIIDI
jgi:hypothetical protein